MKTNLIVLVAILTLVSLTNTATFADEFDGKILDGEFWREAANAQLAIILDVETTFAGLRACEECYETNPLARGLIESGRFKTYAATTALNVLSLTIAAKMRKSNDPWSRKHWKLAPRLQVGAHGFVGILNLRYVH